MKLAGPRLGIRVVLGVTSSRAVVTGCFPPELAPLLRPIAQRGVDEAHPQMFASYKAMVDESIHRAIYGDPSAPKPRGLLNAKNVTPTTLFGFPVVEVDHLTTPKIILGPPR